MESLDPRPPEVVVVAAVLVGVLREVVAAARKEEAPMPMMDPIADAYVTIANMQSTDSKPTASAVTTPSSKTVMDTVKSKYKE